MIPGFAEYQRKTTRVIPIIILTPASPDRINCPSHSFIHSGSITDIIPMPKQRLGETHESSYMHKIWTPDVLQLQEVEKPTPKDSEVLVRIYATAVTAADCELRGLKLPVYLSLLMRMWLGFKKPGRSGILGTDLAGEIEAVGINVKKYKEHDQILAHRSRPGCICRV